MLPRAEALISQAALQQNLQLLSRHAGAPVLLPVKADAYGHGAVLVSRAVDELPELWGYGVASADEALELIEAGVRKPVLLLTPAPGEDLPELSKLGVRVTVSSARELRGLPASARVHLKVNTGMNRLGVRPAEAADVAHALAARGQLEGIFTHFASSEGPDLTRAEAQLSAFREVLSTAPRVLAHACNSGGVFNFGRRAAFDLIRPGIAAYGYAPDAHLKGQLPLQPVLRLRARIGHVHRVQAGEAVSYGALWRAERESEIAVLGIGYADGYPRPATGRAQVIVHGEMRPVVGRICMDQCMVDVSGLNVQPGGWVEVLGPGPIDADHVGEWSGTISYEVLTGIGRRVRRTLVPVETRRGMA
ncbi:alanine racemase [Deinococcus peraridilitoris]|uniref:Alanine racemase n=1 Tax=Deinococcus peraridilitoris (strain DSM 19664 / LMG 22246 / CIP 109416 / KR-200) TaxID=937777 RepID=K9ZWE9_DEIPD|nr:alanine racemase [Deinococcus peraridilitoris]AFZ65973.1 alanine racemase [Deinococcus peraridilitoris DSM 19664]